MSNVELPYPPDWQTRSEYVEDRIRRLKRVWFFCKGRAADLRPSVEAEIKRLEALAASFPRRNDAAQTYTAPTASKSR